MAVNSVLYAGTVGQGIWRSLDNGETFQRRNAGIFMEADVRALVVHPSDPQILYAGTNAGIYRTSDGGENWERLNTPFLPGDGWPTGAVVWSLLIHPADPRLLFAGVCPAGIYRSRDEGANWEKLDAGINPDCKPIVYSRVTCLLADPAEPNTLWAGVEIDGIRRSQDLGNSWERRDNGISSQDIHSLAIAPGSPRTLLAATNNDLNLSRDEGLTWVPQNVKATFPHGYCRGIIAKADAPSTLLLGNGNGPPGSTGSLQISRDGGQTWRQAELPVRPNSTIWTFGTHPALPERIFCASVSGYLYHSDDGAVTWRKCAHEFGEVRCLALVPAA